jgi:hypothetical protein
VNCNGDGCHPKVTEPAVMVSLPPAAFAPTPGGSAGASALAIADIAAAVRVGSAATSDPTGSAAHACNFAGSNFSGAPVRRFKPSPTVRTISPTRP